MNHRFPIHGAAGVVIIAGAEILLFRGNSFAGMYFTPLVWTGYILLIDAVIAFIKGESPLTTRRKEFFISLPLSIICWYIFEGVNLLLGNWEYINLPGSTPARWIGYAWSYATIFPVIFVTAELIEALTGGRFANRKPVDFGRTAERTFFVTGFLLFIVMLVLPSWYLCPLPWISILLWFEGMNDRLRIGSFGEMFRAGDYGLFVSLLVSGLICGLLWEFWNFWAVTKWVYHVPYLPNVKLFEMPVLGFLGFIPFAVECYLMYRFTRFCAPFDRTVDVLGRNWNTATPGGTH